MGAVIAACSPATAPSSYTFGSAGKASAQVQVAGFASKLRFDVKEVRTAGDDPVAGVDFSGRAHSFTGDGCAGQHVHRRDVLLVTLACEVARCSRKGAGRGGNHRDRRYDDMGNRIAIMGIAMH